MTDNFICLGYKDCDICNQPTIIPGCDNKTCEGCQNAKIAYDAYVGRVRYFTNENYKKFDKLLPLYIIHAWHQVCDDVIKNYKSRNILTLEK